MGEAPTKPGRGGKAVFGDDLSTLPKEAAGDPAVAIGSHPIPVADRYLLGDELGRGGMGRVVQAYDLRLGRTVAFKEVLPTGGAAIVRRFTREIQLTARLEHPSIVPLYDSGTTDDGRPFYVMRRVSGRPLDQLMTSTTGIGERLTLLPALLAAIDAVAHAHRRGVIHRDLKPANIVVGDLGETVVIDWGLAKVIGEDDDQRGTVIDPTGESPGGPGRAAGVTPPGSASLIFASDSVRTQIGAVFGTPGFMAPEQARGEPLDSRSDVYALGATLYQLLSGAPPHAGTSATEVIAHTRTRAVVPVATVAPGAPPELVAIVGKALAFQPEGRYADASALGEDVRRFLDGRLVDAHQYTPRQRLARFARRHRAALVVAALAVVAVTVLAWVGVHRIVGERDAADRARRAASQDKAAAERARDELQRRADQLIVMQARGLLDKNPTHALAVLKELSPASPRLGDARATAQAAVVRGAAWTMPSADQPIVNIDLSADASLLAQATRDGGVRVWDLERHRLVAERAYPRDPHALWIGTSLLVTLPEAPPELFDPRTGASVPLSTGPMSLAVASTTGGRVAYLDSQRHAQLLDVATGAVVALGAGRPARSVVIAADGRWIAVSEATSVAVFDATGRELTRRAGDAVQLFGSRFDEVAFATQDKIAMCKLEPRPVWSELSLAALQPSRAVYHVFIGHEVHSYMSGGKVIAWDGSRMGERTKLAGLSYALIEGDRELLVAPGIDGKIHIANRLIAGELHLPIPLREIKVVARPGSPRIVAVGRGLIVGFDLGDSLPEELRFPLGAVATLVDDDTLLVWHVQRGTAQWYDIKRRTLSPFAYEPRAIPTVIDIDPIGGRILMSDRGGDTALVVLQKGSGEVREIVRERYAWGRLLPRGAMLYHVGDGRLFAVGDTGPAREVAQLEGAVDNAVGLGGSRFAAISTAGEVVRGDLADRSLERIKIPGSLTGAPGEPLRVGIVGADRAGRVLIGHGDRLLIWDRDLVEVARLDRPIVQIAPSDDGVMLELADHSVVWMAPAPGSPMRSLLGASSRSVMFSYDGRLAVSLGVNGQVSVLEAPTQSVWDLPVYFAALDITTIAPGTRRFVQSGFGQIALWTLPQAPVELRPWLDERTNATTDDDQALTWPRALARP